MMQAQQPFVYAVVRISKVLRNIKRSLNTMAKALKKLERRQDNKPIVLQATVQLRKPRNNLYPVISGLKAGDKVAISNTRRQSDKDQALLSRRPPTI